MPIEPEPRLYRHTAAGAVIAIVSVLAFANRGTAREVWLGILYFLLASAVAIFFHAHRIAGHLWRNHKFNKTGRQNLAWNRRWQCVVRPWKNPLRWMDVQLIYPIGVVEVPKYYDPSTSTFNVYARVTKDGVEQGRCHTFAFGARLLRATYPTDFGGDNAPMIDKGNYRFEWYGTDNKSIVFTEISFNAVGQMELTTRQKEFEAKIRRILWWRRMTEPL